jgi:toxin ParE1/3/4
MFQLTNAAISDLMSIAEYTAAQWGENQAAVYIAQMDATFHILAAHPHIGIEIDDIIIGYRKHPTKHHIIIYKTTDNGIIIVRILHNKMDVESNV